MFGSLGLPELLFIFALGLVIFGPKRLPQVGRTIGRGLAEFRKASTDLRRTINAELIDEDLKAAHPGKIVRDTLNDMKKGLDGDLGSSGGNRSASDGERPKASRDPADEGTPSSADSGPLDSGASGPAQGGSSDEPDPPIVAAKGSVPRGPKPTSQNPPSQDASASAESGWPPHSAGEAAAEAIDPASDHKASDDKDGVDPSSETSK